MAEQIQLAQLESGNFFTKIRVLSSSQPYNQAGPTFIFPLPREMEGAGAFTMDWQQEALGEDFLNSAFGRMFYQGPGPGASMGGALGNAAAQTTAGLGFGGATTQVTSAAGAAKNPLNQLVFKTPNLRQFQFTWDLVPLNEQAAEKYKNMIKTLRAEMHPEIGDFGYIYPKTFDVEIIAFKKILFKSGPSAMTSMITNPYGAGVPSFHKDGEPVHTVFTLEFQELFPNSKAIIQQLYGA